MQPRNFGRNKIVSPHVVLSLPVHIRDFKIQRRGRQRERKKNNKFYKRNDNFARASRFSAHFFARFCTTAT